MFFSFVSCHRVLFPLHAVMSTVFFSFDFLLMRYKIITELMKSFQSASLVCVRPACVSRPLSLDSAVRFIFGGSGDRCEGAEPLRGAEMTGMLGDGGDNLGDRRLWQSPPGPPRDVAAPSRFLIHCNLTR